MNCRPEEKIKNIPIQEFQYISTKDPDFIKVDLTTIKKPSFSIKGSKNTTLTRNKSLCRLNGKYYQKKYLLGEGTYGKVYLFVSLINPNDKIVVKEEKPFYEDEYNHIIKREAIFNQIAFGKKCGIAGDINNPNEPIYIASPLLNYPQLASVKFHSPISLLKTALSIVNALIDIHEKKHYIHGDVKADNIFLKVMANHHYKAIFNDHTFSGFQGETIGGLEASYIAPELKNATQVHQNQDIYSLGKLLKSLFRKHFKLISTEYRELVKLCNEMSHDTPDKRIDLAKVKKYFISKIRDIESNHQLCSEKFFIVQEDLKNHIDEKNLLHWMELQALNSKIKITHFKLSDLEKFSEVLGILEQKKIPTDFERLKSSKYINLLHPWNNFYNIFKKINMDNRKYFLDVFGDFILSNSINTAQQFATVYAMISDDFKKTLLQSLSGITCIARVIKNYQDFCKITKHLNKNDFFTVWDNLSSESQQSIIMNSPKKLLNILNGIKPQHFFQAINKLDIDYIHSIFKTSSTLTKLIISLEDKGEIFLAQLIKISIIKKGMGFTMTAFDKCKSSDHLYKKILTLANDNYHEFRSLKPKYLHCYGVFFGYPKEEKLKASHALKQIMSGHLSQKEMEQLKSKYQKLYESGDLMQVASRHFKC